MPQTLSEKEIRLKRAQTPDGKRPGPVPAPKPSKEEQAIEEVRKLAEEAIKTCAVAMNQIRGMALDVIAKASVAGIAHNKPDWNTLTSKVTKRDKEGRIYTVETVKK